MCGTVVSGNKVLGFKGLYNGESPFELTNRALVFPMMSMMGYGTPRYDFDRLGDADGTVLAVVPMNRPLDDPMNQVLSYLRGHRTERGLATNGFTWMLLESGEEGLLIHNVNLRPYYIEALDRRRFRIAESVDLNEFTGFLRTFSRIGFNS